MSNKKTGNDDVPTLNELSTLIEYLLDGQNGVINKMSAYYQNSKCRCDLEAFINLDNVRVCEVIPHSRGTFMTNYENEEGAEIIHFESVVNEFNEKFNVALEVREIRRSEWHLQGTDKEILAFIKWVK